MHVCHRFPWALARKIHSFTGVHSVRLRPNICDLSDYAITVLIHWGMQVQIINKKRPSTATAPTMATSRWAKTTDECTDTCQKPSLLWNCVSSWCFWKFSTRTIIISRSNTVSEWKRFLAAVASVAGSGPVRLAREIPTCYTHLKINRAFCLVPNGCCCSCINIVFVSSFRYTKYIHVQRTLECVRRVPHRHQSLISFGPWWVPNNRRSTRLSAKWTEKSKWEKKNQTNRLYHSESE